MWVRVPPRAFVTITTSNVADYLRALREPPSDVMAEMEALAERDNVPIVMWETGRLLAVLVAVLQPRRVLEVGTAIGYSTLHLAGALSPEGRIVTLERDPERIAQARGFWQRAGVANRIEVVEGDALETLPALPGTFDMAFVDATKQEYGDYLGLLEPKLTARALVAIDNVLMSGEVALEEDADTFWSKENLRAARELNRRSMRSDDWLTSILPIGDGVTLTTRRPAP
jgi:predicted O-methyltransferase YrrM